jgi:hypothetical protein
MKHKHNWQFVKLVQNRMIYDSRTLDVVGFDSDIAHFICHCGKQKMVEVK